MRFLTRQQIYDKVKRHLIKQNARAKTKGEYAVCAYRAKDGKKCAIGCLLPDQYYAEEIEGTDVEGTFGHSAEKKYLLWEILRKSGVDLSEKRTLSLLSALQIVHDCHGVESWEMHLKKVAKRFGLRP